MKEGIERRMSVLKLSPHRMNYQRNTRDVLKEGMKDELKEGMKDETREVHQ